MNWLRILLYRLRHGQWCPHDTETSYIGGSMRKVFRCDGCGRVVIV